jgi:hypothetical protein
MSPLFSPVGSGGIGKATVNASTGSPTVNNNARAGKTIYQFNGAGLLLLVLLVMPKFFLLAAVGLQLALQQALLPKAVEALEVFSTFLLHYFLLEL